jgi:hypothetical protein
MSTLSLRNAAVAAAEKAKAEAPPAKKEEVKETPKATKSE